MYSIAARRVNKRVCQLQPNGMFSRGTMLILARMGEQGSGEVQGDVNLPSTHGLRKHFLPRLDVLHLREPLARQ